MLFDVVRYTVIGLVALCGLAALGSWAVRTRRLSPFGKPAQLIRRSTDPILHPIERWLFRRGGNPQHAASWLVGGAVVGGIVVIGLAGFLIDQFALLARDVRSGPFAPIRRAVYYAGQLVTLAIVARVIGSWVGVGRFNRFMRPAYWLTDWIIEPLRRVIPPVGGMLDVTPIVAFFLVRIAVSLLI